jgi:hypothetical protein
MMHGPSEQRLQRLFQVLPIDRRTLERWRKWWTEILVQLPFWKGARGRFAHRIAERRMPLSLVDAFDAWQMDGLVNLMRFLSPITTVSCTEGHAM